MCQYIDSKCIVPGWGCCQCHLYNGMQRENCRGCGRPPCAPLQPDDQTGTVFETRLNHRVDPGTRSRAKSTKRPS